MTLESYQDWYLNKVTSAPSFLPGTRKEHQVDNPYPIRNIVNVKSDSLLSVIQVIKEDLQPLPVALDDDR